MNPRIFTIRPAYLKWIIPVILALLIIALLLGFQPLGMYKNQLVRKINTATGLASAYAGSIYIFLLLGKWLDWKSKNWTRGNVTLLNLSLLFTSFICVTGFFYFQRPIVFENHISRNLVACLVGVVIVHLMTYLISSILGKDQAKESEQEEKIEIILTDHSRVIRIELEHFIFAKSSNNYLEVYETKSTKPHLVRKTMKDFLDENPYDVLYRCHKSYVVNKNKISTLEGNSKGYKVAIKGVNELYIPVSREKGADLREELI